jgi:hypothetical protein
MFRRFVIVYNTGLTSAAVQAAAEANGVNVRVIDAKTVGVSFGETITEQDTIALLAGKKSPSSLPHYSIDRYFLLYSIKMRHSLLARLVLFVVVAFYDSLQG